MCASKSPLKKKKKKKKKKEEKKRRKKKKKKEAQCLLKYFFLGLFSSARRRPIKTGRGIQTQRDRNEQVHKTNETDGDRNIYRQTGNSVTGYSRPVSHTGIPHDKQTKTVRPTGS